MKDFFQTLLKPDWDDNPKKSEILLAANKLEVGEFQFLQLAYKEWHGHELPKTLEMKEAPIAEPTAVALHAVELGEKQLTKPLKNKQEPITQ